MKTGMLAAVLVLGMTGLVQGAEPGEKPAAAAPATPPDRAELEKKFVELLSGAELVGSYTASDDPNPGKEDRYSIMKVVKAEGDEWKITFNMGYKKLPIPLTITIPVQWVGDTPVMMLTNKKIPGMGTFNARILFHEGNYAGTWSSPRHGGTLWGRVEKEGAATPKDPPAKEGINPKPAPAEKP